MRLYVIVETNKSSYGDQQMVTRNSEKEVIQYAGILSSRSGLEDNIEIDRIFSVDEYGNVDHHEIEFKKGKLVLCTLPAQK
ncbi:hypothetical protein [Paenibacillus azoreducens]|uniref:Uncharacterized protein n=1 Tax=Paenibacillus azoreducens TaxID=116718 RepID=A0A920CWK1_9BACL|nr:hypothetical protein [Paenibacillus azoreducens]GIO51642.1 hypothetical protein J34TS1_64070 [Paenibacillus azoreducens]